MKKISILICTLALTALMAGCSQQQTTTAEPIGIDAAKTVALEDAGITTADASFTTAGLDRRGDLEYYDVEFTAGGQEYEYEIDALTGVIIERAGAASQGGTAQTDNTTTTQSGQSEQTTTASSGQTGTTQSGTTQSGTLIGEATAKAKALAHAGLTESEVTFIKQKLDWDDGRQVYDVEFYTADYKEYDYEIDALTGDVLAYDYDAETWFQTSSSGQELTAAEAKALALAQVPGATEADIWEFSTDRDDGRLEYEGEIIYSNTKYEFEIDGYSGTIRNWEVESVYR